jgi:hypothetical protein
MSQDRTKIYNAALDAFGQLLIKRVRDAAIQEMDMILERRLGFMDLSEEEVQQRLASFDAQQLDVLRRLVPEAVDTTLHHLVWTLDQVEFVDVAVQVEGETVPSLRKVSEGLDMDYSAWVPKFTSQRYDRALVSEEVIEEKFEKEDRE